MHLPTPVRVKAFESKFYCFVTNRSIHIKFPSRYHIEILKIFKISCPYLPNLLQFAHNQSFRILSHVNDPNSVLIHSKVHIIVRSFVKPWISVSFIAFLIVEWKSRLIFLKNLPQSFDLVCADLAGKCVGI